MKLQCEMCNTERPVSGAEATDRMELDPQEKVPPVQIEADTKKRKRNDEDYEESSAEEEASIEVLLPSPKKARSSARLGR